MPNFQSQLDRIEKKVDLLIMQILGSQEPEKNAEPPVEQKKTHDHSHPFYGLTVRQHVVAQMLMNGRSNAEIGERLGVQENTAKVHVRTLGSKFGSTKRRDTSIKIYEVFKEIDEASYVMLTHGIGKDWDTKWNPKVKCPHKSLYNND